MTLDELITQVRTGRPEGAPLDHLTEAAAVAGRLDELADHLVGHFVDQARRSGASWTAIGQSMGVSKQAAQKRFVGAEPSLEQFTNRAKVVVLKAQNAARERGEQHVTSLHLLLGLLAEWEGLAGQAIEAAGVSSDAVAGAVAEALPEAGKPARRHATFSTGLARVLERSVGESLRLGHDYVGTEHVLLALLDAADEPGARVLTDLGVARPAVEAWTLQALTELRGR
ncbi:MAG TPA: Clp protease N-terminal domain-containing protein [Actinomycetes bacterium]|nr:Clp protease N-terminal domain-containing protein [Actinomycetes bacterium]